MAFLFIIQKLTSGSMVNKFLFLSILICCLLMWGYVRTEENIDPSGTLVVSYEAEPNKERLDRIRFLLIDENNRSQMYPKANAYVDDRFNASRMVVIENLKTGKYQIEFLIPNSDGMFDPPPVREVTLEPAKITKISLVIKLRGTKGTKGT